MTSRIRYYKPAELATLAIMIAYFLAAFKIISVPAGTAAVAVLVIIIIVDSLYWEPRRLAKIAKKYRSTA